MRRLGFLLILAASLFGGVFIRYVDENFLLVRRAEFFKAQVVLPEVQLAVLENQTLLFVGDIMLARGVEYYINKYGGGDYRYPFLKIADALKDADLLFGNLEGPISERGKNQGSIYSFRMNPKAIEGLKFAGFDVLSLANNHILDWGREALEDTLTLLSANRISPVGAGNNYTEANTPKLFAFGDTRLAVFAYTNLYPKSLEATASRSGISQFEPEIIKKKIFAIRQSVDLIVVSFHWGGEYATRADKFQKSLARELIDAGADLVIGHHPHVVQEVEQYKDGWIAYSLGNFVFDQNFSEDTKQGLMLKVVVKDKKISEVQPIPIKFTPTFQPELVGL